MSRSHNDFRSQMLETLTSAEIADMALDLQEPKVEKLHTHRRVEFTSEEYRVLGELMHHHAAPSPQAASQDSPDATQ